jgi:hypothetical protein
MLKQFLLLAACALLIAGAQSFAQEAPEAVREVINEKLKVPLGRLQEYLSSGSGDHAAPTGQDQSFPIAPDERLLSGDVLPESEVHAAINPVDPMNIVVSPIRLNLNNMQEALVCPVYYTKDFGITWSKSAFRTWPSRSGSLVAGGGDPVFAFDANGKLYFSWINLYLSGSRYYMGIFWAYSIDGGVTFQQASNALVGESSFTSPMTAVEAFDKQWLAVDRTNSPWRNTVYAAFYHPDAARGQKIEVRRKLADSTAFTMQSVRVSTSDFKFTQFTSIAIDPAGGVHVTFFGSKDSITYALYHATSTDGAANFGAPVKITDANVPRFSGNDRQGTVPGIQNQRIYPCPHIVIDHSTLPTRGFIYATWSGNGIDRKESNGMDVYFSRSTDNGASWSAPVIVNDDAKGSVRDQFHPSLTVNNQGVLSIIWYDRREDAANASARLYYTQSADGGVNFARNRPVASQPMNLLLAGSSNSNFAVGEYNQVLMTDEYIIPFWADGRGNDGNLDVYGAFIPIADATAAERIGSVSEGLRLERGYPNPASGKLSFTCEVLRPAHVRLVITDLLGREAARLVDGDVQAGRQTIGFDTRTLAPGSYYATLASEAGIRSVKFLVTR